MLKNKENYKGRLLSNLEHSNNSLQTAITTNNEIAIRSSVENIYENLMFLSLAIKVKDELGYDKSFNDLSVELQDKIYNIIKLIKGG